MERRSVLAALGMATAPFAGCSRLSDGSENGDADGDGQSGSSADGAIELAIAGATQTGDLDDFEACSVRIGQWSAVDSGGARWESEELDVTADLTQYETETKRLGEVWVDVASSDRFDEIRVAVPEATGTLAGGKTATVTVSSPLRYATAFELDEVETVSVTLDLAPVDAGRADDFRLELADGTVTTSPSV